MLENTCLSDWALTRKLSVDWSIASLILHHLSAIISREDQNSGKSVNLLLIRRTMVIGSWQVNNLRSNQP